MTVWAVCPPLIENIMEVYMGSDTSGVPSFVITANVRYDLTCPLYEANPPVDISIQYTNTNSENVEIKQRLNSVDPIFKFDSASFNQSQAFLIGQLQVDYNSRFIYFGEGASLMLPNGSSNFVNFPLQGVLFYQWYSGDPIVVGLTPPTSYPTFTILKTMNISNVYSPNGATSQWVPTEAMSIQTTITFDASNTNPTISLTYFDNNGNKVSSQALTSEQEKTTQPVQLSAGQDYAGIDCKIRVDFTMGCVFFDGYTATDGSFHEAKLKKPLQEVNPGASDYQIRFCRIFDWLGKIWPNVYST